MPLFFIDIHDGQTWIPDLIGHEFTDADAAREGAIAVLPTVARHPRLDLERRDIMIDLRDGDRGLVFKASLSLVCRQRKPAERRPVPAAPMDVSPQALPVPG